MKRPLGLSLLLSLCKNRARFLVQFCSVGSIFGIFNNLSFKFHLSRAFRVSLFLCLFFPSSLSLPFLFSLSPLFLFLNFFLDHPRGAQMIHDVSIDRRGSDLSTKCSIRHRGIRFLRESLWRKQSAM